MVNMHTVPQENIAKYGSKSMIGNMHVLEGCRMPEFELDIKYSFKGFISDNGVLYERRRTVETHAFQIIRKT